MSTAPHCETCGDGHARDLQGTDAQAALIAASDGGDRDGGTPIHDDVAARHPNLADDLKEAAVPDDLTGPDEEDDDASHRAQ